MRQAKHFIAVIGRETRDAHVERLPALEHVVHSEEASNGAVNVIAKVRNLKILAEEEQQQGGEAQIRPRGEEVRRLPLAPRPGRWRKRSAE